MPKLVESSLSRIRVPKGKRDVIVFDTECPGFAIRKFSSGKSSFLVQYSCAGQRRRLSLGPVVRGTLADARRKAKDVIAKARMGEDVMATKQVARDKTSTTLADLIPRYLDRRESDMAPAYFLATERFLNQHFKPLHGFAPETVRRADVVRVLDDVAETRGKVTADRARAALSGLYAWLIERGYADTSPVLYIKPHANGGGRERVLSEDELRNVWHAVEGMGDYATIIRLLILTGQRKSEIGDLSWQELNPAQEQIELPGTRTKNKRPHIIPLSSPALEILDVVPQRSGRDFLFGEGSMKGFQGWSWSKAQLGAKLPADMPAWTIHDLRRSVVTHLNEREFADPIVIEACVNHQSGHRSGVAGVYNKSVYRDQKRAALQTWGEHVRGLVAR